ncbi:MAG TPA: hypothetical protein VF668_18250 [Pyrinomonadaceae bacterium]|jgi:hypothetical protein
MLIATALPVVLAPRLWEEVWSGVRVRAWDGTGHYALAQIYDRGIFPDTFGWTHAYFAGMPLPNFYPPAFYWAVAALHHTHLFSLPAAFKLVLCLSVLLIPAALWWLARAVTGGGRLVAACAAFAVTLPLVDARFSYPIGLNNFGTFMIGLFTQPLGFVLLAAWYAAYLRSASRRAWVVVAAALLALTVLANFFNAITAVLFICATVGHDAFRYARASDPEGRASARSSLAAHLLSPPLAAGLTAFWVLPVLSSYELFVTRPQTAELAELVPPAAWVWYGLALAGLVLWLRRPGGHVWPFLITLLALSAGVAFAATVAPRWFPLQAPRFLSTLNFLLAVPVGVAAAAAVRALAAALGEGRGGARETTPASRAAGAAAGLRAPVTTALLLCVGLPAALLLVRPAPNGLVYYRPGVKEPIEGVLEFAGTHRDGRYLVEVPPFNASEAAYDGRALTSYLGAQGNETLSVVFREASPSALFFNPLVNAFSAFPDNFGLSSTLGDDLDFFEQPLARHIERARAVGVKYVVAISPWVKDRLGREGGVEGRFDLGDWSVFALRGEPAARVRPLAYRPALVVSDLSFKQRRRNEYSFTRLAEEQFADGWFDVLLARSPETKLDRLKDLDGFGALVLDTYDCDDAARCAAVLRDFAARRPVVMLSSDAPYFGRLREALADLPLAQVVERAEQEPGPWLEPYLPKFRYGSSDIRRVWGETRRILDRHKAAVEGADGGAFTHRIDPQAIVIEPTRPLSAGVPVLVATSYHTDWTREDGQATYPATPFFTLTFVGGPARMVFARSGLDHLGLLVSALALLLLCAYAIRERRSPPRPSDGAG